MSMKFQSSLQSAVLRLIELIEAEWRICASPNYATIGSDNGLSHDRRQAITWTNTD